MFNYQQVILLFFIGCMIGWLWESIIVSLKNKRLINRGYLYGPFIPLYGFGSLIIYFFVFPFKESYVLVFVIGMVLTTILELLTGLVMEKILSIRYWDYSTLKYNYKGVICLYASLCWGIASLIFTYILFPYMKDVICSIPMFVLEPMNDLLLSLFLIDVVVSTLNALNFKETIIHIFEKIKEYDSNELKYRIDELMSALKSNKKVINILKRNPTINADKYKETLDEIKEYIKKSINR